MELSAQMASAPSSSPVHSSSAGPAEGRYGPTPMSSLLWVLTSTARSQIHSVWLLQQVRRRAGDG